jgi:DNA invertase Pin-like site-specific DNA recombinase
MPTAYGYVRVSDGESDGADAQKAIVAGLFDRKLAPEGYAMHPEFFYDEGVSRSVPFERRPKGGELCKLVRRGDAIVIPRIDRAFGSVVNMRLQVDAWQLSGVRLICSDATNQEVDTGSPLGTMFLTILAMLSEFEVGMSRTRNQDRSRALRKKGRPLNQTAPLGLKIVKVHGKGYYQPNPKERELMAWVVRQIEAGYGTGELSTILDQKGIRNRRGTKIMWRDVARMARMERNYRLLEKEHGLARDEFVTPDGVVLKVWPKKDVDSAVTAG